MDLSKNQMLVVLLFVCRAIFRWVVAMDLSKNQVRDIVRPQQTNSLVRAVKAGKETYHQLFKKLCR